ncbi:AAA family ATPase [Paenibacillus spongiae]|uniref:AAA family ATPase n=1 Tax=Paenibacillus spongiae TaxID=2909671 RepID=A0ABY5S6L1_9BACL|nr:AAA family ATPase [Paenibacillus spongiae]UVI27958.1 AAA family ATPase [Paenibacillus spongiae]
MRWVGLHVDGFGKLNDFFVDMDAPITVIYGPNEAGKSTTLGFIRTMLYGFATKANRVERQEPSSGGKHGGRLLFRDHAGRLYSAERYAVSSGRVSVRMLGFDPAAASHEENLQIIEAGEQSDRNLPSAKDDLSVQTYTQEVWERLFLGGVNERVYRQLFAITLTELQAIGMLEGDELGKQLYHAGWSGGASVAQVEKKLNAQLDGLFRPRGSTQAINRHIKKLDTVEADIRKMEDGIEAYQSLTAAIEAAEAECEESESRLPGLREQAILLARACSLHPLWVRRLALQRERDVLERTGHLPADARSRWEGLRTELDRLQSELDRLREAEARTGERLRLLDQDQSLAARWDEIQALLLSSETMEAAVRDRVEIDAELREHKETIERLLQRIAPNWTEQRLRTFRVDVAEREWIRRSRADMSEMLKSRSLAEAELRSIRTQQHALTGELAELNHPLESAWTAEPAHIGAAFGEGFRQVNAGMSARFELLPASYEALRHAARAFDDAWREWELEQMSAAAASPAPASPAGAEAVRGGAALWAAAGTLAAAAAAMTAAGWHTAAIAAIAASAALALSAALARTRARASAAPQPRAGGASAPAQAAAAERRVAAALRALVREPEAALGALSAAQMHAELRAAGSRGARSRGAKPLRSRGLAYSETAAASEAPGGRSLREELLASVEERLEALRSDERSRERRQELQSRLNRLQKQGEGAEDELAGIVQREAEMAQSWREWLLQQGLPESLSPEAALETVDLAEQALHRQQACERIAAKAAVMDARLAEFHAAVAAIADEYPGMGPGKPGDAVLTLRLLHAEATKQAAVRDETALLDARLAEQEQRINELQPEIARLTVQRSEWFEAADAASEPEFLAALASSERLSEVESELYKLQAELGAGMRPDQLEQLTQWYTEESLQQLQDRKSEAENMLRIEEQAGRERLEKLGRHRQALDQLMHETVRQKLTEERESAAAALEELVSRYAVLSLGLTMINRTKRVMEEQRQPAVLRDASRFMAMLSNGKYKRIAVPEGMETIRVETADNRIVDSMHLSRGTAEQLYLSMRFALADEAAASVELPMILDDLFVNFDASRLEAAIELLREISGRRQLVLLTCHDHVRDLCMSRLPGAKLVELTS